MEWVLFLAISFSQPVVVQGFTSQASCITASVQLLDALKRATVSGLSDVSAHGLQNGTMKPIGGPAPRIECVSIRK
jgi:hypothetical protein